MSYLTWSAEGNRIIESLNGRGAGSYSGHGSARGSGMVKEGKRSQVYSDGRRFDWVVDPQ